MTAFVLDDFVDLLKRTTDPGWLDPILADPDSAALLLALATEFVRMGRAGDLACLAGAISTAPGGAPGVAVLTVTRDASGTSGAIPKGFRFVDERGIVLVATGRTPVASGDTVKVIHTQTLRRSELVNTEDDAVISIDPQAPIVLDGAATTVLIAPAGSPGIVATTFATVASATQILGGVADYLSLHGKERGQLRQAFEEEEAYRLRVRNVPDAVAPIAVADGVLGAAQQVHLPMPILREPFEDGADPATKTLHGLSRFDPVYVTGSTDVPNSPKVDFFDDMGVGRELVSRREARAYFRIDVPGPIRDPDGLRMFFDDGFFDDPVFGFADVHDHPQVIASLMALWEEANRKRAGGVQFDVFLDLDTKVIGVGSSAVAGDTVVWTIEPPLGKLWWIRDAYVDHDTAAAGVQVDTTVMQHRVRFTFEDTTTFFTDPFLGVDTERLDISHLLRIGFPFKRISKIEGFALSNGTDALNVVGSFIVLEAAA